MADRHQALFASIAEQLLSGRPADSLNTSKGELHFAYRSNGRHGLLEAYWETSNGTVRCRRAVLRWPRDRRHEEIAHYLSGIAALLGEEWIVPKGRL